MITFIKKILGIDNLEYKIDYLKEKTIGGINIKHG